MSQSRRLTLYASVIALAAAGAIVPSAGQATTVTFGLDTLINGSTPTGTPPWLTAQFKDIAPNTVELTLTNTMPVAEFTDDWLFNVNPSAFNPATFTYTFVSGDHATIIATSTQSQNGGSNIKAGLFDIHFNWPTANVPDRFSGGETTVYDIVGTGLTAPSFEVVSINDPGPPASTGGWFSAAHVQGIPFDSGTTSGSIGTNVIRPPHFDVPEPASLALVGLGLLGTGLIRRRKRIA